MKLRKRIYFLVIAGAVFIALFSLHPVKRVFVDNIDPACQLVDHWPNLPENIQLGNPAGIAIDTAQNLVVFHRADRTWPLIGSMPKEKIGSKTILIIDKNTGKLMSSWGDHLFVMPHGLTIDQDNHIWVTDVALNQVFKFSHEGKLLMSVGEAGVAGNDAIHFDRPTDIAVAADGSFYVSDGYGNSRIIKFSSTGKYLFEWGKKGRGPGEFRIPHGIALDSSGNVYVADRENNRLQVFTAAGKFIRQYTDKSFANVCAITFDRSTHRLLIADDLSIVKLKHTGSDIIGFDTTGKINLRFGRSGAYSGPVCWYHDICTDKEGNIYTADIKGNQVQKFKRLR